MSCRWFEKDDEAKPPPPPQAEDMVCKPILESDP